MQIFKEVMIVAIGIIVGELLLDIIKPLINKIKNAIIK